MASLKTALVIAFVLALSYQHVAAMPPSHPRECCFALRQGGPLPVRNIDSYYRTDSQCNLQAVVFVMKSDKKICVNPTERWVQRAMSILQEKK